MRSMIGHVRDVLSTYRSDAITPIVLQPDMVYANLWALHHSYSFHSVTPPVTIPRVDCSYVFFYFMFHPFLPTLPAVPVHDPSG